MARQTRPATPSNSASGIEFLEDDAAPESEATPEKARTAEGDAANQQAAARAIASFRVEDARREFVPAPVVGLSAEQASRLAPKLYRVAAPAEIRKGAASYKLAQGKVIDSRQYDVAALIQQGVKLEEIPRA